MTCLKNCPALYPEEATAEAIAKEVEEIKGRGYGRFMLLPAGISVILRTLMNLVHATVSNVFLLLVQLATCEFKSAGQTLCVILARLVILPLVIAILAVATPIFAVVNLVRPLAFFNY